MKKKCEEKQFDLPRENLKILSEKSKKSKDKAFIRIEAFWGMAVDLTKEEGHWKISEIIEEYEDTAEE